MPRALVSLLARPWTARAGRRPASTHQILSSRVEVANAASARLGEGAIWIERLGLYASVDIYGPSNFCDGPAVFLHNPAGGQESPLQVFPMPSPSSTVVPRARGGLIVALRSGLHALDPRSGTLDFLVDPGGSKPGRRWNDGKASPDGRFWGGTMGEPVTPGAGSLYVVEPGLSWREAISGVTISNGLAWDTLRGVMYYIDTPTGAVAAFDYDAASGTLSQPRTAFTIPPGAGLPDGCAVDAEGNLWVAHWGGGRVVAYRAWDGGTAVAEVHLPAAHVTSCAFGGPGLRDLYVTTAWEGLTPPERSAQPHAGHSFIVRDCGFEGVPAGEFAG